MYQVRVEQVAAHEAGHAVATVALGFLLRFVRVEVREFDLASLSGNPSDMPILVPQCETGSSAADVRPDSPNLETVHRAAVVALAGRHARRQRFMDADAEALGQDDEGNDLGRAARLLGLSEESELARFEEATKALLIETPNQMAITALASEIVRKGRTTTAPAFAFSSYVDGSDATKVIRSCGVISRPGRLPLVRP